MRGLEHFALLVAFLCLLHRDGVLLPEKHVFAVGQLGRHFGKLDRGNDLARRTQVHVLSCLLNGLDLLLFRILSTELFNYIVQKRLGRFLFHKTLGTARTTTRS